MAFGKFVRFQITVGAAPAGLSEQSSLTHDGVTFTFDRPVEVGQFVTGEPFVLSTTPFSITAISPAAGDLEGDGHIGNGAMLNPYFEPDQAQGFDSYIGSAVTSTGPDSANTAYSNAVNVDPAINGAIAVAQGQKGTVVKSVRLATTTDPEQWDTVDRYVPLTILDTAPPEDAYRPGMSGTTKRIRRRSDIDFTPRGYTLPASFPTPAEAISKIPPILAVFGPNGEQRRRFRTDKALGTTTSNYSGAITPFYSRLIYMANAAISEADRQAIIDIIATHANDLESVIEAGWRPQGGRGKGAGQGGGVQAWLFAAAALFRDETLLAAANAIETSMLSNGFWVTRADVGQPALGKAGVAAQTFFDEHIGIPFLQPDEFGSHAGARYVDLGGTIAAWEIAVTLSFDQGPPSRPSGYDMIVDGGPFDATNQRAASLAFLSRWDSWKPSAASANGPTQDWRDTWNQVAPLVDGFTPWAGPPDQPPYATSTELDDDYFIAGDGRITLRTPPGFDYATEPVLRADMRYSLDGVQWVEVRDVSPPHIVEGLLKGAKHWLGWRQVSASGASPWSANFPAATPILSGIDRGVRTTTGAAPAAAPVNTVAPEIHRRLYPDWDYPVWQPAPANLSLRDGEVAAGAGYWSGYPAPVLSYQWTRNGTAIAGATAKTYRLGLADEGTALACRVTATNASGATTAVTAPTTVPKAVGAHVPQAAPLGDGNPASSGISSHSTTGVALGPEDPDRWIALLIGGVGKTAAISAVTLNGTSFVRLAQAYPGAQTGFAQVWVSSARIPTGLSGTVAVSSTGIFYNYAAEVVRLVLPGNATVPLDSAFVEGVETGGIEKPFDLERVDDGFLAVVAQTTGSVGGQTLSLAPDIETPGVQRDIRGSEIFTVGMTHSRAGGRTQTVTMGKDGKLNAVAVSWRP